MDFRTLTEAESIQARQGQAYANQTCPLREMFKADQVYLVAYFLQTPSRKAAWSSQRLRSLCIEVFFLSEMGREELRAAMPTAWLLLCTISYATLGDSIFPMGKAEPPTIAVHANRNTQEYNRVRPTIDNAAANVKESGK